MFRTLFFAFCALARGFRAAALLALPAFFWLPAFWLPAALAAEAPPAGIAAPKAPVMPAAEAPSREPDSQKDSKSGPAAGYTAKCNANFQGLFECYKASPGGAIQSCIPRFSKEVSEANRLWNQLSEEERRRIKGPAAEVQKYLNNIAENSQRSLTDCLNKGVLSPDSCRESAAMIIRKAIDKERLKKICGG